MIIGIFTHFFALETTLAERQFFRALAKLVGRRAARLSACGIAAIVSKMNYDGSAAHLRHRDRNTLASRIACTRACKTSLATKAGKYSLACSGPCFCGVNPPSHAAISSPITPRTEAVSGALSLPVRSTVHQLILAIASLSSFLLGMTKIRKDKGLYLNV